MGFDMESEFGKVEDWDLEDFQMTREEILGRNESTIKKHKKKGCGYLGRIVTYPGGKYEEVGDIYIDLVSPHCMLVLGKRGTGKSYTLGVVAENFGLIEKEYREKICVIAIDTMSIFSSIKKENTITAETKLLKNFHNLKPRGFEEFVNIYMPMITIDWFKKRGQDLNYDHVLTFTLNEVETDDWLSIFKLDFNEPMGIYVSEVIDELKRTSYFFGFKEIYEAAENLDAKKEIKVGLKNLFRKVEALNLFAKAGSSFDSLISANRLNIMDIGMLNKLGGLDVRNLVVTIIARRLLKERTLYTTLEMQQLSNLVELNPDIDIFGESPLVYMIIDEAHLFLPSRKETLSTDILIDWIKLGRHPGLSLILATQEPAALHESAIRQSDIILAHNITSNDDIKALGKAKQSFMSGKQDIQKIVAKMEYRRGLGVVFDDNSRKVRLVKIRPRLSLHTGLDASALKRDVKPPLAQGGDRKKRSPNINAVSAMKPDTNVTITDDRSLDILPPHPPDVIPSREKKTDSVFTPPSQRSKVAEEKRLEEERLKWEEKQRIKAEEEKRKEEERRKLEEAEERRKQAEKESKKEEEEKRLREEEEKRKKAEEKQKGAFVFSFDELRKAKKKEQ